MHYASPLMDFVIITPHASTRSKYQFHGLIAIVVSSCSQISMSVDTLASGPLYILTTLIIGLEHVNLKQHMRPQYDQLGVLSKV